MVVTNNYPRDFRKADLAFDFILADVPCSGEGMFRKDPQAIQEWCPQNVEKCAELQRSIIEDIWPSLKPGGILVYSTCTYNEHEDEKNIQWIIDQLGAQLISIPVVMARHQRLGHRALGSSAWWRRRGPVACLQVHTGLHARRRHLHGGTEKAGQRRGATP